MGTGASTTEVIKDGGRFGPEIPHVGRVFYVDSGSLLPSDFAPGRVLSTIAEALDRCVAYRGDVIYLAPNHAEAVASAAAIDIDVNGVSVIGMGRGSTMATLTLGTATTATVKISAANVMLKNIRFTNNIDSCVKLLDVSADNAIIDGCEFVGSSTKEYLSGINIGTTYDNTWVRRCKFIQPTDPGGTNGGANTGAIYLVDSENVLIEDCEFRGCFETAFIHNRTTGAANLWVRRCYGQGSTLTNDSVPFVLATACSGGADRCSLNNPNEAATTEATLSGTFPAAFFNHQTYFGNDGGGGQLAIASQSAAS